MDKYRCVILLPLTAKGTGVNPIGYPLMVFGSDPKLDIGDRRILRYEAEGRRIIDFSGLVVNRSEHQENSTHVLSYVFEVEDRSLALQIAELIKSQKPEAFEEDNFS